MPAPIVVIGWIFVLIAAGGIAIKINWDKILKFWGWKRVAVLGERDTGKTTLIKFLTEGSVPEKYTPTQVKEKIKKKHYKLEDLSLKLRESHDVPGDPWARDQWKNVVLNSDIIIYLVNSRVLFDGDKDRKKRVEEDAQLIRGWLMKDENPKVCMVVGTFADKFPGYRSMDGKGLSELSTKFAEHPTIKKVQRAFRTKSTPEVPVFLGSLEDLAQQEVLVMTILNIVAE